MLKITLFIALTLGCLNIIQTMNNTEALAKKMKTHIQNDNWFDVFHLLFEANKEQKSMYLHMLLNTKNNLNIFNQHSQSLLGTLVFHGAPGSDCDSDQNKQKREYLKAVLKELIKHNKLDPNLTWNGKSVIHALDEKHAKENYYIPQMFSKFLQQICDDACDEAMIAPRSFTTKFHTYVSFTPKDGFRNYHLIWRPLCLLVDYRVWAAVGALVVAGSYFLISHKKKPSSQIDEEQEENSATSDNTQSTIEHSTH